MQTMLLVLVLRVVSLVGATLNTLGFLTFFFWPSLQPYRWHMIASGLVLIVAAALIERSFVKRLRDDNED